MQIHKIRENLFFIGRFIVVITFTRSVLYVLQLNLILRQYADGLMVIHLEVESNIEYSMALGMIGGENKENE